MYESPVESKTVLRDEILFGQDECAAEVTRKSADAESVTPNSTRHTFPFFGKKLRLFAEDDAVKPLSQKKSAEESEDGLKLPPNMQQIASDEDPPKRGIKFREFFRKSRHVESETGGFRGESDVTSDPLNEQIPVEVNIFDGPKQEAGEQMKREKRRSVFGVLLQNEAVDRDSDENGNERRKSRDRRRMTLKSIFGIEAEEKKTPKEEMQQRAERAFEGIVETDVISHADVERMTEFKRMETEVVKKNLPEIDSVSANPPGRMPPPGRWGPKSRKLKAFSKPEATHFDSDDNSAEKSDVPGERGGILTTRWKKNKKKRPVSFADEPTIFDIRSDTESEDRGSADKSSVSKLTEEKQKKRFLPQTLDSIKRKNKDKPVDIEAVKSQAEKDAEQETQKSDDQKNSLKADGIVYAELDIVRPTGSVVRSDVEKTEYAEIVHNTEAPQPCCW